MMQFLWGALTATFAVVSLFFLRFWGLTRDRLFLFFAAGFLALAANWLVLAVSNPASEVHHRVYLVRLAGFLLIIVGIVEKNRPGRRK